MTDITLSEIATTITFLVGLISGIVYLKNAVKGMFKPIETRFDKIDKRLDELSEKLDLTCDGDLNILRQSLLKSCEDYISRGYITLEQSESLSDAYEVYHKLGGDSFITDLVKRAQNLPIDKKDNII